MNIDHNSSNQDHTIANHTDLSFEEVYADYSKTRKQNKDEIMNSYSQYENHMNQEINYRRVA